MAKNESLTPAEFFRWKHHPFIDSPEMMCSFTTREQRTLQVAEHLLNEGKSFAMVGPSGTGKTSLVRALLEKLDRKSFSPTHIHYAGHSRGGILRALADTLRLDLRKRTLPLLTRIHQHLIRKPQDQPGVFPVIVIDDAHLLEPESLFDLCSLLAHPEQKTATASMILIGDELFRKQLRLTAMSPVKTRMACLFSLEPLSDKEAFEFIAARIKAGGGPKDLFDKEALEILNSRCRGNKREWMNMASLLCLEALAKNEQTINAQLVLSSDFCENPG
jgi:general secretion pathway protein A